MSKKLCILVVVFGILSDLICVSVCANDYNSVTQKLLDNGFETERLIAGRTEESDIPILAEYLLNKAVTRLLDPTISEGFTNKKEAAKFLTELCTYQDVFTIRLKDSMVPVGQIFYNTSCCKVLNVGYWVAQEHQNKGYVSEVALPLTKLILGSSEDIKSLYIACTYDNIASARLADKICNSVVHWGIDKYTLKKRDNWLPEEYKENPMYHYWEFVVIKTTRYSNFYRQ